MIFQWDIYIVFSSKILHGDHRNTIFMFHVCLCIYISLVWRSDFVSDCHSHHFLYSTTVILAVFFMSPAIESFSYWKVVRNRGNMLCARRLGWHWWHARKKWKRSLTNQQKILCQRSYAIFRLHCLCQIQPWPACWSLRWFLLLLLLLLIFFKYWWMCTTTSITYNYTSKHYSAEAHIMTHCLGTICSMFYFIVMKTCAL